MLYDNSQLARAYLHAWQVTGNGFFRAITEEILDYVVREMTHVGAGRKRKRRQHPRCCLLQHTRPDSEGEEGKFFIWTPDEIRDVLSDDAEADAFMAAYGVTRHGNASIGSAHGFEGKNILEFVGNVDQRPALAEARRKLFLAREVRVHRGSDDVQLALAPTAKVLTSWNGLMLAAFAEAARACSPSPGSGSGEQGVRAETYRMVAECNADFLLRELRQENGRLLRTWKACPEGTEGTGEAKLNGYLEDSAYLIEGLLELYQTTFEARWFVAAQELAETMLEHFADSEGIPYHTSDDHETLITRPRDLQGNATPSGNAMVVTGLLKLAGFTNELRYVDIAHQALAQMQTMVAQYPLGLASGSRH